nr:MAG TPA: hypothetical protein [Caudoviricetes sp.]
MKTATSVWPVRIRTSQRSFLVTSAVTMTVKQMTIRAINIAFCCFIACFSLPFGT